MVGLLFFAKCLGDFELPGDKAAPPVGAALQFSVFVVGRSRPAGAGHRRPSALRGTPNRPCWFFGRWERSSSAGLFNWTVNGRTILPMVPAASILIVRRIDRYTTGAVGRSLFLEVLAVGFRWAPGAGGCRGPTRDWRTPRESAATEIRDRYGGKKATVRFAGHWGFQYYMESYGFMALDCGAFQLMPGDILVLPENNTNVPEPPPWLSQRITLKLVSTLLLTTMHPAVAADFYGGDDHSPLPLPPCRWNAITSFLLRNKLGALGG